MASTTTVTGEDSVAGWRKTTAAAARKANAVPHLSVAERIARGKAARAEIPRSRHAEFEAAPDRGDPIELLEAQAKTRVPELVPIRYGRMFVSPFTFYRGAAKIMAHDLPGRHGRVSRCSAAETRICRTSAFRLPRAPARLRHQRFRRDASGPVGMGRQAACGQHADRGARQRLQHQGPTADRARHRHLVPRDDAPVRRDGQPGGLVRPSGDRGAAATSTPRSSRAG